jgi:hypothetical protein
MWGAIADVGRRQQDLRDATALGLGDDPIEMFAARSSTSYRYGQRRPLTFHETISSTSPMVQHMIIAYRPWYVPYMARWR